MRICDRAESAETERRSMTLRALSARVLTALFAGWNISLMSQIATAQTVQFSPEMDVYVNLRQDARLSLQAGRILEEDTPNQAAFGANLEVYVKPLLRLRTAVGSTA